jgi:hypothetical protein
MTANIFSGTIPAPMTPCKPDRTPDFDMLAREGAASATLACRRSSTAARWGIGRC